MRQLDWDDLRFFLAVAGAGSLSAAARQLRVNTTTVLRRIAQLEEALDARLFERLRSGYRLTPSGTRLMENLNPVDQQLSALERDFKAGAVGAQGLVKLAANEIISTYILAAGLPAFHAQHPHLTLSILPEDELFIGETSGSLPRITNPQRDVDVAIRSVRPTNGDMLMRKIGDMAYALYAPKAAKLSPATKQKIAQGDLSDQPIIGFCEEEVQIGAIWWLSRAEKAGHVTMRTSSAAMRATMLATSQQPLLAALPCIMADEQEGLERVVAPEIVGSFELWLLVRKDLAKLTHVRAAMDWLIAHIATLKPHLAGHKTSHKASHNTSHKATHKARAPAPLGVSAPPSASAPPHIHPLKKSSAKG